MEAVLQALALPMGYVLFGIIYILISELCDRADRIEREKKLDQRRKEQQESFKKQWDAFYESRRKQK